MTIKSDSGDLSQFFQAAIAYTTLNLRVQGAIRQTLRCDGNIATSLLGSAVSIENFLRLF